MKLLIILSLCAVAMAEINTDPEVVKQHIMDCAKLTNLNPDDIINQNPKLKTSNKDQLDCYWACMDKKMNFFDEHGKFNMDGVLAYAPNEATKTEMREKVQDVLEKCKQHENDPCKLSACVREIAEASMFGGGF